MPNIVEIIVRQGNYSDSVRLVTDMSQHDVLSEIKRLPFVEMYRIHDLGNYIECTHCEMKTLPDTYYPCNVCRHRYGKRDKDES